MKEELENSVIEFIEQCSNEIGKYNQEKFETDMLFRGNGLSDIASPIEQILFCALKTVIKLNDINEPNDIEEAYLDYYNEILYPFNVLAIEKQKEINKYRVDFFLTYWEIRETKKQKIKEVIVECDSQQWHERTEKERRYEKRRDRYFQSNNYKIFHFTGSEITQNPLETAREIITYLTNNKLGYIQIDSNIPD